MTTYQVQAYSATEAAKKAAKLAKKDGKGYATVEVVAIADGTKGREVYTLVVG